MKIIRTFDADYVRKVCTHHRIWGAISADGQDQDDWAPCMDHAIHWLVPMEDDNPLGVFMVYPLTGICWEVHTAILPDYWGGAAGRAAKALIHHVFAQTACTKLITHVPENNQIALRFAQKAGMVVEWVNRRSIFKAGRAMDQTVLAIYKE